MNKADKIAKVMDAVNTLVEIKDIHPLDITARMLAKEVTCSVGALYTLGYRTLDHLILDALGCDATSLKDVFDKYAEFHK